MIQSELLPSSKIQIKRDNELNDQVPFIALQPGSRYWIMHSLTLYEIQERLPMLLIVQSKGYNFYVTTISFKGKSMFTYTYSELDLPIKCTHRDLTTIELSVFIKTHFEFYFQDSLSLASIRDALDTLNQVNGIVREDHDLTKLNKPTLLQVYLSWLLQEVTVPNKKVAIIYNKSNVSTLNKVLEALDENTKRTQRPLSKSNLNSENQIQFSTNTRMFINHVKQLCAGDSEFLEQLLLYKQLQTNICEIFPEGSDSHSWHTVISALFRKDLYASWRDLTCVTQELIRLVSGETEETYSLDNIGKVIEMLTKPIRFNAIQSLSFYYSQMRELQDYVAKAQEKTKKSNHPSLFKEPLARGNTFKNTNEISLFFSKVANWILSSKSKLDVILEYVHSSWAFADKFYDFFKRYDQILRKLDEEVSHVALHMLMQQCQVSVDTWKQKLSHVEILKVMIVQKVRRNQQLGTMYSLMLLSDRIFILKNILDVDVSDTHLPPLAEPEKILTLLQSKKEVLMVKKCWMLNECLVGRIYPTKLEFTDCQGTMEFVICKGDFENFLTAVEKVQFSMTLDENESYWFGSNVYLPMSLKKYQETVANNFYDHVLDLTSNSEFPGSSSVSPLLSSCVSFTSFAQETSDQVQKFLLKCQYLDPLAQKSQCKLQKLSIDLQSCISIFLQTIDHLHQSDYIQMVWSSFARRRYNYLRNYVIGSTMQAQVQSGVHEFYSPSDKTGMSTAPSIFSKCSVTSPTSKLVSPLARKVQERQQRGYGIPMDRVSLRPSIFSLFSFRERSAAVISQTTLRDILEIVRKYVQNYSPLSATSPKKKIPPPSKSQLLMLMKEKKEYKVKYLMQAPPSLILDPLCEYILLLGSLANVQITLRLYDLVQLRQIDANLDYKEEVFQTLYLEQDELKRKNLVTFVQILTQNYPKQQLHTTYVRDALFLSYYNSPHSSKRLEIILHEVEQMVDLLKLLDRCPYGQACVKDIHASIAQLQLKEDLSTSSTLPEVNITLKHSNPPAVPGLGDSATVLLPIVEENEEELA